MVKVVQFTSNSITLNVGAPQVGMGIVKVLTVLLLLSILLIGPGLNGIAYRYFLYIV